jgi:hypothetical protein
LVGKILGLFPKKEVHEYSSMSAKAWDYSGDGLRYKVVYLQERNEAAGSSHPARLFISEGGLRHDVTEYVNGRRTTKTYEARGPICFISTTTSDELEVDDETRHISVWLDESSEQTRRIARNHREKPARLSRKKKLVWKQVQWLLKRRLLSLPNPSLAIRIPNWFRVVEEGLYVGNVRVRRYYLAFLEACRTVCLLRSFHRYPSLPKERLEVDFAEFSITTFLFDSVFVESLHGRSDALETRQAIEKIMAQNGGQPIQARDLEKYLGIPKGDAYRRLRDAAVKGTVNQENRPEKNNRKLYTPVTKFIPDPQQVFDGARSIRGPVRFLHPITGKRVVYRRDTRNAD